MKKIINLFGKILGFAIIAVIVAVIIILISQSKISNNDDAVSYDDSNWMSNLDDNVPLNQIILPGSHNSASENVKLGIFNKCQDSSILTQLQSGCRYLDLGLGEFSGELIIKEGKYSVKSKNSVSKYLTFENVLDDCYLFLNTNPNETILLALNYEYGNLQVESFEDMLKSYFNEKWYISNDIPKLGDVRGKVVLLRQFEGSYGIPFLWQDQKRTRDINLGYEANDNISYVLYVQDRYEYDNDEKWNVFICDLGKYDDAVLQGAVCYNGLYTNGSFSYSHPIMHAKLLNSLFLNEDISTHYGWYIFDYFDINIARHVYQCNYQF